MAYPVRRYDSESILAAPKAEGHAALSVND